jgi:transcriptional regulator with XRE-family HTH domain
MGCLRLKPPGKSLVVFNLKPTQREVAEKWALSQQSISKIENAKDDHISLHTLNEYARVLGYELQFMLKSANN